MIRKLRRCLSALAAGTVPALGHNPAAAPRVCARAEPQRAEQQLQRELSAVAHEVDAAPVVRAVVAACAGGGAADGGVRERQHAPTGRTRLAPIRGSIRGGWRVDRAWRS